MKLTTEQIAHVNRELKELERLINADPKKGLFRFVAKQEALWAIIELHNIAIRKERETMEVLKKEVKEKMGETE